MGLGRRVTQRRVEMTSTPLGQVKAIMAKKISKKKVAGSTEARKASKGRTSTSERRVGMKHTLQKPTLLSGDNPQIAKGYGDEPVQAYIAAIPGWKRGVAAWVDSMVTSAVPAVHKAVKWNSPLYGVEDQGWFLGLHCYARYVKVAFFKGAHLSPRPPGESKQRDVRYLDIREGSLPDPAQFADWVLQASRLPGEKM